MKPLTPETIAELTPEEARAMLPEVAAMVFALSVRAGAETEPKAPTNGDGRLLSVVEAAGILNTTPAQVWRWSRRKSWTFVRRISKRSMRLEESGLRRWLADQGTRS